MGFFKSKHCNDISLKLVIKFCWHFYAVSYTSVDFVLSFLLNFERKKKTDLKLYTTMTLKVMVKSKPVV